MKRQKKMLSCVPKGPGPEFVRMSRDLAHHLVQKYGKEVFRIGFRRFVILALMEIGCNRATEQALYRANLKYQAGELANEDFDEAARLLREIDRLKGELK